MSRPWQALRALRLRLLGPAKELVGTDQFGNKYYRVPQHETRAGQIIPERRFVEAINRQAYQYEMGDFPTEWEAWIRKKRRDPPTTEKKQFMENERLLGVMVHSELQDCLYLQFQELFYRSDVPSMQITSLRDYSLPSVES
ncbi:NADH dehydrogenase [ubiquinone] 1 alpha subcomplex assembly factor 2 isoform X4 [Calonectris borealis]|uniref:NADH dehydrogenase [ubiquinone] 1 alpha subcomplex assembly factor 2 isoform X4 n=1 Tax=Calonectris borealis TaxID=1323832 RepID=UPI003F4BAA5C